MPNPSEFRAFLQQVTNGEYDNREDDFTNEFNRYFGVSQPQTPTNQTQTATGEPNQSTEVGTVGFHTNAPPSPNS